MKKDLFEINFSFLLEYLSIYKIIYFGKINDGNSDIDLVIISDDFENMFIEKRRKISKELIRSSRILDIICLTTSEFEKLKDNPTLFGLEILGKGSVLYG